jgi:hypothetical protein
MLAFDGGEGGSSSGGDEDVVVVVGVRVASVGVSISVGVYCGIS